MMLQVRLVNFASPKRYEGVIMVDAERLIVKERLGYFFLVIGSLIILFCFLMTVS
jgi:hypothetical protein